ncbi:TonB-dependent receptor [Pectinatus haikarae]|uniref:Iron complex outermembrane receptor protein n=1 Tax=Pectinatus haikarae TaxID=349096 RepID=A0ABT9YA10_9FIRM|nr:TonB-dependent siderophore receptor [Pectinatus haikarae]MDQ0204668.1 iron complex outermembrane receptor protein [Pectinatus haikarae]
MIKTRQLILSVFSGSFFLLGGMATSPVCIAADAATQQNTSTDSSDMDKKDTAGASQKQKTAARNVSETMQHGETSIQSENSKPSVKPALDAYILEDITIKGTRSFYAGGFAERYGNIGFLGRQDTMNTPFSSYFLSEKTIEAFGDPTQPLDSILANVPSIRQSGSLLHNDFTFRGFRANGTSSYVNGIPGIWTQFNAPTNVVEKVEIISGPNSGISGTGTQYESNTAGGIINFVTKRAGDKPLNRYTQTFSGSSLWGEYLDIGQRFGRDNEWGIRINAENLNGQTSIDKEKVKAKGISMDIDHRSAKSTTNLFMSYRDIEITNGQRWFLLGNNVTRFPSVPDASKNYSFDGMIKGSYGWVAALNHEQVLNKQWKVFFNAGFMRNNLDKNLMYANSAVTLNDNAGNFAIKTQSTTTPQESYYLQTGATGTFKTGELGHTVTIAADRTWRQREAAKSINTYMIGTGNIYTGIIDQLSDANGYYLKALSNKTNIWGVSVLDSIDYKKFNLLVGVHKHNGRVDAYNTATGALSSHMESDAICPTYAVSYKPTENIYFYASHSENFDVGTPVGTTYKNAGTILPPAKTKQNEIGIKYTNKGFLTTLSAFDIKQANNIDVIQDSSTYYEQEGSLRHRGIELAVSGNFARKWSAMGGISYLNAKYEESANGQYNGIQESGRPAWSAVGVLKYAADNAFDVIGRIMYTGRSPVLYEKLWAPSYTTFDLGVNYKTRIMKYPATISLMCYNLLNKDYWMIARGDNLYLSTPRTLSLSVSIDF